MTRNSGVATKQAVTAPRSKHAASQPGISDLPAWVVPGRFLTCLASAGAPARSLGLQPVDRALPVVRRGLHRRRGHLQHRSQSASASTSRFVVPRYRVSAARRAGSRSDGTRIVATICALPISMPHTGPGTAARRSPLPRVPHLTSPSWTANLPIGTARGTGGRAEESNPRAR